MSMSTQAGISLFNPSSFTLLSHSHSLNMKSTSTFPTKDDTIHTSHSYIRYPVHIEYCTRVDIPSIPGSLIGPSTVTITCWAEDNSCEPFSEKLAHGTNCFPKMLLK